MAEGTKTRRKHARLSKRRAARFAAIQALYQIELTAADPLQIVVEFQNHRLPQLLEPLGQGSPDVDDSHFQSLVTGVSADIASLDAKLTPHLVNGWTLQRCGYLLRACLRSAAFEIIGRHDVPPKSAIAEYVRIGEMFLGDKQAGVINAVLDRLARQERPELFD